MREEPIMRPLPDPHAIESDRPGRRSRWAWWPAAAVLVGYVLAGLAAHHWRKWLPAATLATYGVADVFGLLFILRYRKTDWRYHPWGRHVMAFMVCLELLFTLALSRRVFGLWPGLEEAGFLISATFAGTVVWRYLLQVQGDRRLQEASGTPTR